MCSVAGWGIFNHSDPYGNTRLNKINVPIVNHNTCKRKYAKNIIYKKKIITDHHICAGPPETCHVNPFNYAFKTYIKTNSSRVTLEVL